MRRRLAELHGPETRIAELIAQATDDPGWRGLATLDATTRLVSSIVRADGLMRGETAAQVLTRFIADACAAATWDDATIPSAFWFVEPVPRAPGNADAEEQVLLRGAVLVRVAGVKRRDVHGALEMR